MKKISLEATDAVGCCCLFWSFSFFVWYSLPVVFVFRIFMISVCSTLTSIYIHLMINIQKKWLKRERKKNVILTKSSLIVWFLTILYESLVIPLSWQASWFWAIRVVAFSGYNPWWRRTFLLLLLLLIGGNDGVVFDISFSLSLFLCVKSRERIEFIQQINLIRSIITNEILVRLSIIISLISHSNQLWEQN